MPIYEFVCMSCEELLEQLPRGADERHALFVLVKPRCLADEHQICVGAPGTENDLRAPLRKGTFGAPGDLVGKRREREAARTGVVHAG